MCLFIYTDETAAYGLGKIGRGNSYVTIIQKITKNKIKNNYYKQSLIIIN